MRLTVEYDLNINGRGTDLCSDYAMIHASNCSYCKMVSKQGFHYTFWQKE